MRFRKSDTQDNSLPGSTPGFFRKVFARRRLFRLRSASRSPYGIPGLGFGAHRFVVLAFFAVGMAYVEAACVVYLWEILYPEGFKFPLLLYVQTQYQPLVGMEFGRELATLVMLVACAIAAGRTIVQKVAAFLFLFGVWDIFYYGWLRVITGLTHFPPFPASLGTWDILFLIPVPWTGPVFAPVVVAVTLALFAVLLVFAESRGVRVKPDLRFWIIEGVVFLMILGSFIWNCGNVFAGEVPAFYPWWLLLPGEIIGITAFLYLIRECFSARA
jgi:hypothetical protein